MGKRVLVVDDDPDFVEMLTDVLSPEGYHVSSCLDPSLAQREVVQQRPDVVIVDLLMPGCSGWQVIEQLKDDRSSRGIRLIVCTGAVPEVMQHAAKLRQLGCDVLLKPFELSDLLGMLRRATATANEDAG